jgi:hypothetical protein
MKIDNTRQVEADVRDRIDMVFENYTLDQIMEMNDLTEQDVIYLLFMEGHISEPEAYFP